MIITIIVMIIVIKSHRAGGSVVAQKIGPSEIFALLAPSAGPMSTRLARR